MDKLESNNNDNSSLEEDKNNFESTNVTEAFFDNSSNSLHHSFLKNKRQLINALNGKSDIYEKLRQKSKALDMFNMILINNKCLIKKESLEFSEDLKNVFNQAKNDKTVFENISKRVKQALSLITKNQLSLDNINKFDVLCNNLIDVLNTHFEIAFMQQILDILKTSNSFLDIFNEKLIDKYFKGRNLTFKNQDIRYLIRNCLKIKGPYYFIKLILKYGKDKNNGGARTAYQLKQIFDIINYTLEQFINKINLKNIENSNEYEEVLSEYLALDKSYNEIYSILAIITSNIKDLSNSNLKINKNNNDKNLNNVKDKHLNKFNLKHNNNNNEKEFNTILIGYTNFILKLIHYIKKYTQFSNKSTEEGKTIFKSVSYILSSLMSIIKDNKQFKNLEDKLIQAEELIK